MEIIVRREVGRERLIKEGVSFEIGKLYGATRCVVSTFSDFST